MPLHLHYKNWPPTILTHLQQKLPPWRSIRSLQPAVNSSKRWFKRLLTNERLSSTLKLAAFVPSLLLQKTPTGAKPPAPTKPNRVHPPQQAADAAEAEKKPPKSPTIPPPLPKTRQPGPRVPKGNRHRGQKNRTATRSSHLVPAPDPKEIIRLHCRP